MACEPFLPKLRVPVQKLVGYPQKHPIFEGTGPRNVPLPAVKCWRCPKNWDTSCKNTAKMLEVSPKMGHHLHKRAKVRLMSQKWGHQLQKAPKMRLMVHKMGHQLRWAASARWLCAVIRLKTYLNSARTNAGMSATLTSSMPVGFLSKWV